MGKNSFVFILLLLFTTTVWAEQVTSEEAQQKARAFLQGQAQVNAPKRIKSGVGLVQVWPSTSAVAKTTKLRAPADRGEADYYIFNTTDGNAFVVVSGESTTRSILAYSTEGAFSLDDMAPSAQDLLDGYAEQIELIKIGKDTPAASEEPVAYDTGKLLVTANWRQNPSPWYDQCPYIGGTHALTGCVATAMAIVMKYHNWPDSGTGSHSYTSTTHGLTSSANFGEATYNWSILPNDPYLGWTDEGRKEVAKIMYHCGVAMDMDYSLTSSGAYTSTVAEKLIAYFKYSRVGIFVFRSAYKNDAWINLLKAEIDADRPVLVSGTSNTGAHAFVCDGYDGSGLLHFNMGWGGSSNGYYSLDQITTHYQYVNQGAAINIKPALPEENELSRLVVSYSLFPGQGQGLIYSTPANVVKGTNFTVVPSYLHTVDKGVFNGLGAVALYSASGELKGFVSDLINLSGEYDYIIDVSCNVPEHLKLEKDDILRFVSSEDSGKTWNKCMYFNNQNEHSWLPVSGYDGVFFCDGNNGEDAYVFGDVTAAVKSTLSSHTSVTRIDMGEATNIGTSVDLTGANPNAYAEGTSATVKGVLTKSLGVLSLTDNYPYYADGTHTAANVSYKRVFNAENAQSIQTAPRWQTICLPFNVSRITYGGKSFSASDYWLYKMDTSGYTRIRTGNIEANTPYLIAFANAPQYVSEGVNVSGEVTFEGSGILQTDNKKSGRYQTTNYEMCSYYGVATSNNSFYALNAAGKSYVSGDVVSPFHPYLIINNEIASEKGRVVSFLPGQSTGIENVDAAHDALGISSTADGITVTASRAGTVRIVSPNGALIAVVCVQPGVRHISLPNGLFIVNGTKVYVK